MFSIQINNISHPTFQESGIWEMFYFGMNPLAQLPIPLIPHVYKIYMPSVNNRAFCQQWIIWGTFSNGSNRGWVPWTLFIEQIAVYDFQGHNTQ